MLIGLLHLRGAGTAIRFQNVVTYGFIALMVVLVGLGLSVGSSANLTPAFGPVDGRPWTRGTVWVFSLCVFFLNGWQSAIHAIEERQAGVEVRHAVRAIILGIIASTLLYCGIILSAASAIPWQQIVAAPMPARMAFDALVPQLGLGTIVLVAAAVAVAKTWSAVAWLGSRLAVALARERLLPQSLAVLDAKSGAPRAGILLVTILSLAGPLFGRSAILPIIDMVSICIALSILLGLAVLIKQRRTDPGRSAYTVPGGMATAWLALLLAFVMIGTALVSPLLEHPGQIPVEWLLIGVWGAAGGLFYAFVVRRPPTGTSAR